MKLRNETLKLWLGLAVIVTALLLTAPPLAAYDPGNSGFGQSQDVIPSPEPATLTLLALGGGGFALARYRKSRRKK
jgi:PEP-CTERM motif-containing protein